MRYPDFLAVDEASLEEGSAPHVESVSVKMRNFKGMSAEDVRQQVIADAREATSKYGGRLEVRRPGHPLYGRTVQVSKIHLVYEAQSVGIWSKVIEQIGRREGVEVHFE